MTEAASPTKADDKSLRRNLSLVFSSGIASSTGGQLASASLVLPFLYMALGAPVFFVGLLLPVMKASQLTSELLAAPFLREIRLAKFSILWPTLLSAGSFAVIAIASDGASKAVVVGLFMACAVVLGFCKGIKNVGIGQLFGSVVPEQRRGWFRFSQATIAGTVAIAAAWLTKDLLAADTPLQRHIIVLWVGIAALIVAGVFIAGIRLIEEQEEAQRAAETPGLLPGEDVTHEGHRIRVLRKLDGVHIMAELKRGLVTGMHYPWFRRYLVTQIVFLSVWLAMPFYMIHAASYHTGTPHGLTILVIAASAGIVAGAPLWGKVSATSHRLVMVLGAMIAAVSASFALLLDFTGLVTVLWLYAIVIFLLSFGSIGVAGSTSLYLIEMTSAKERPCLLAFSDVATGIVAIAGFSVLGFVAHLSNPTVPLMVLLVLNIVAVFLAMSLTETHSAANRRRHRLAEQMTEKEEAGTPAR